MEVDTIVESRESSGKHSLKTSSSSKMMASLDDSILKSGVDVLSPMELRKRTLFHSKEELTHAVKQVHIWNHQEITITRSDPINRHACCKWKENGCKWKLKVRKRSVHNYFEIMESSGPHTYMNPTITQDHANLKSSDIAEAVRA